jgi:predicted regulator of Ras-like GTPase activity (Roadblock/LC7/MglB family)
VLAGREGLPIEAVGHGDTRFLDLLGALGASAYGSTEALGHELASGQTVAAILEFERALVSVDPVGEFAIVVTLADNAASLGTIRHTVRAIQGDILRTLDVLT